MSYDSPLCMVPPVGIEPTSSALQTGAMTTLAQVALVRPIGFEPMIHQL